MGRTTLVFAGLCLLGCGQGDDDDTRDDTDVTQGTTKPTLPTFDEPIAVCINEIMAENTGAYEVDDDWPDWVELHNPTDAAVSLEGWSLTDSSGERYTFGAGVSMEANGFLVLFANEGDGAMDLPFRLDNDEDSLVLTRTDQTFVQVDFPDSAADYSFARSTDCCADDCWQATLWGTPGESNTAD